jgi:hypothetical protein
MVQQAREDRAVQVRLAFTLRRKRIDDPESGRVGAQRKPGDSALLLAGKSDGVDEESISSSHPNGRCSLPAESTAFSCSLHTTAFGVVRGMMGRCSMSTMWLVVCWAAVVHVRSRSAQQHW